MFYDPRKNEYLVTSNDTLEGFSDQEQEEEEGHSTVGCPIVGYEAGGDFNLEDPNKKDCQNILGVTNVPGSLDASTEPESAPLVESFVNSETTGGGTATTGGDSTDPPLPQTPFKPKQATWGNPVPACYDGGTYRSQTGSGDPTDGVQGFQKDCDNDVACKGFTTVKDYPNKGRYTVQFKNRISDSGFGAVNQTGPCQTYVPKIPTVNSVSEIQTNITTVANPALPVQQDSPLDLNNLAQWSGPSSVEVSASKVNQNWPGGTSKGDWNWNAVTLPKDTNYYMVDGSARDQQVIGLPEVCRDSQLNPEKAGILKDPSNPGNLYVYVDGRKMPIKSDIGPGGSKMCYTPAYWVNPDVRTSCGKGIGVTENYDSTQANDCTKAADVSTLPAKDVSASCFNAIPTIQGSGPGNVGSHMAVNCKSDVRPSDRVRIVNQVSKEGNLWSNRGRKNAMLYNAKTEIASSKYDTITKSNSLLRKQVGNNQSNNMKIDKLNNSIYSQQRQVEIANDETRRRNENLFLLKLLLTYCLVLAIPLMLKKVFGDAFKNSYVLLILVFITIPFIYILVSNLYAIRNRSPVRWPLRNWPTGPLPADDDLYEEESQPTCPPPPSTIADAEEEALAIQEEIDELQKKIHSCEVREEKWKKSLNQDKSRLCRVENKIPGKSCSTGSFTF